MFVETSCLILRVPLKSLASAVKMEVIRLSARMRNLPRSIWSGRGISLACSEPAVQESGTRNRRRYKAQAQDQLQEQDAAGNKEQVQDRFQQLEALSRTAVADKCGSAKAETGSNDTTAMVTIKICT